MCNDVNKMLQDERKKNNSNNNKSPTDDALP